MELIKSRNREEQAVKVLQPSKNILQRSLCQLFLLEFDERLDNSDKNTQRKRTPIDKNNVGGERQNRMQSRKQTPKEARYKICGQYLEAS